MIPVVWLSLNPDAIARGYWDQSLLEDLFDRLAWRPAGALEYVHIDYQRAAGKCRLPIGVDFHAHEGSVVVVGARHHADLVDELNEYLAPMPWVLLVLTGDEENVFPIGELRHPRMRVWGMNRGDCDREIPTGYTPDTPEILATPHQKVWAKERDWWFAGQITHPTRKQCADALRFLPGGHVWETSGFTQGLERDEYLRCLATAKLAPCPSGPVISDTFRLAEALEAGCVPVTDAPTQLWSHVLRDGWSSFPDVLPRLLERWAEHVVVAGAWWQGYKRELAYALDRDVRELSGIEGEPSPLTVVIPTSPTPSHPDTDAIETVVGSVRDRMGDVEIVIVADGVRPEQTHLHADYLEYLRRLLWLCAHEWHNVICVPLEEWGHQANVVRRALDYVETPSLLFLEHDTPLVGDVPWRELCGITATGEANAIRLHHESHVQSDHEHLMLDREPRDVAGVPLLRTVQWSSRPHFANAGWYRRTIERDFPPESRTMVEDRLHGLVVNDWHDYALAGWDRWRLFMYAPPGNIQRSDHLDTRGSEPKFEMQF